ncbi:MAG: type II toxin-antitoxin system HicB family antitoxin [Proteobacteria bacterium]|nr:type II toxin-antitoxin system HicB family antitoxin [Pseudomonadota bacterium]MBU1685787.1 type II toxin-antitoxin system HicB family antitoxin [Pseudomonadota bacterium]
MYIGLPVSKQIAIIKGISRRKNIREFSVIIEKDEDGYFVASVPAFRGCHTQAKSLDTLMKRVREAIELCLEVIPSFM